MQKQPRFVAVFGALALSVVLGCGSDAPATASTDSSAARADARTSSSFVKDAGNRVGSGRSTRAKDNDAGPDSESAGAAANSGNEGFEKLAGAYCDKLVQCTPFGFERSYESGDDCRKRRMLLYSFWAKLPDTGSR